MEKGSGKSPGFGRLIGASKRMQRIFSLIEKAAKVDLPVLVVGETGTGKELAALEIHHRSARKNGPFIAVNMGALPTELIGSELFGHVKGSFTGAHETKEGRFAEAEGGTLFLDEITSMDERVQIALLRVLETRHYRKVGGNRDLPTDVRVIAAANIDPRRAVREGAFRADLLYRLQVLRVNLPPLRHRKSDIDLLADRFLRQYTREFDSKVSGLSAEVVPLLREYDWSGNVRELKNVIAQAVVMAEKGEIGTHHLPSRLVHLHDPHTPRHEPKPPGPEPPGPEPRPVPATAAPRQLGVFIPMGLPLQDVEKAYVLRSLAAYGNNKAHTARVLGISRKTLYDKLTRWQSDGGPPA